MDILVALKTLPMKSGRAPPQITEQTVVDGSGADPQWMVDDGIVGP